MVAEFSFTSRRRLALFVLFGVVVLAGCTAPASDDASLPEPGEAAEVVESLDGYQANVTETVRSGNTTELRTGELIANPGTNKQRIIREWEDGFTATTIRNGTVRWSYDSERETVRKAPLTEFGDLAHQEARELVALARSDEPTDSYNPLSPLFTSGEMAAATAADDLAGPANVSYEGVERVGDREAHVISVEGEAFTEEHFLDTEWFITLERTRNLTFDGETFHHHVRLEDIEFDPTLPDDVFEFTPSGERPIQPVVPEFEVQRFEQPGALADRPTIEIPEPDVPDEFAFEMAAWLRIADGDGETEHASLIYTADTATLTVSMETDSFDAASGSETVTVAGQPGQYREVRGERIIAWGCEGSTYRASGNLPRETLESVAGSVGC